jgi:amino acid transporter/nucleotide-binding universal stress UspA family protein
VSDERSTDEGFGGYEEDTDLARDLSLFDITMIGVGAMIGAGIFVLSGLAAGQAGPALIMAFAFNGFITIFTAMVYAELGSAIPEAGGGYLWVREALGRSQAFIAGWMSWFAHAVAGSLYTLGFGSFVTILLVEYFNIAPPFGLTESALEKVFAAFAGILFTYITFRGAKETGLAGNIVTGIKVAVIYVFVIAGFGVIFGQPDITGARLTPFLPRGANGVFIAMGLTFIAFEGYEIIVQSGEEVVDPQQNIPKAVFYSMAFVVLTYILVAVVLLGAVVVTPELLEAVRESGGAVGLTENSPLWKVLGQAGELGLARAAGEVLPYGTLVILIAGIFSTLSALNATTYSSTRVSFAMGRDSVLPDFFEAVHPEKRTPYLATLASGALIVFMAVALPIEAVAAATDVMFLLLFLQVNYAAIVIRREYGDQIDYGYIMPYFPYVPIVGIITKLFLAVYLFNYSPLAWYGAIAWIGVGVGIFYLYSRGRVRSEEIEQETRLITEERASADRPYQVLVPIANPDHAQRLVKIASAIARRKDGELLLTAVATVPAQTPLSEAYRFVDDERDRLEEAMGYVPEDVPAHRTVTVGHRVGQSITNVAAQRDSDVVLMGWRGRRKRVPDYVLGSIIDEVIEGAPCDVATAKVEATDEPGRVLVPTAGGPHGEFAEDIAAAFASARGAEVTLMNVATADGDEAADYIEERRATFADRGIDVSTDVIPGSDIAESVLDYANSGGFDTVVIGAAGEGLLQRAIFGDIPETVGERFGGQVLMGKKHRPVQSLLKGWTRKWIDRGTKARERLT